MVKVTATIYKRTKNWVALLYIIDGIYPPRRKSVTTDIPITKSEKTARKSAEEIRRKYEEELNNNLKLTNMSQKSNNDVLFCDYMINWLEMVKPNIRETTYGGYHRIIHKKIYPYFKNLNITLTELKPIHIQAFYSYLFKEFKLKGATVKRYHANILSALSYAEKMDVIYKNPAKKVTSPKAEPFVPNFYNKEELQVLFDKIIDTPIRLPVLIGAFYGFRREEILGLKWEAIDFENNSITVNFTVTETSYDGKHKIIADSKTKTSSSYRTLPLIPEIKTLLLEEKKYQNQNKKIFQKSYLNIDGFVCVNEDGSLIKPDYLTHKFHEIIIKNNLKQIRLHDLRHSCASLLLKNAISMKDIQIWLGHSSFNTTANLYAHVDKKSSEISAKVISNVLSISTV